MSGGDDYETVDDTSGLEMGEEDSFVNVNDTRSDQGGGVRGASMEGKSVEVVTRSGKRAGRVVCGQ